MKSTERREKREEREKNKYFNQIYEDKNNWNFVAEQGWLDDCVACWTVSWLLIMAKGQRDFWDNYQPISMLCMQSDRTHESVNFLHFSAIYSGTTTWNSYLSMLICFYGMYVFLMSNNDDIKIIIMCGKKKRKKRENISGVMLSWTIKRTPCMYVLCCDHNATCFGTFPLPYISICRTN